MSDRRYETGVKYSSMNLKLIPDDIRRKLKTYCAENDVAMERVIVALMGILVNGQISEKQEKLILANAELPVAADTK